MTVPNIHIQPQRTCKTIKSKAIIDDKDKDEVEIVRGDVDVTMGASDGPITATSGSDTTCILINYPGFTASFNHTFSQMTIDNLFDSEVEVKTTPKDKGKIHPLTKVSCVTSMLHRLFKITNAHKIFSRLPSNVLKWSVSLMLLSQVWILKAIFITRLLLLTMASLVLPATSMLVLSPLSSMGQLISNAIEVQSFLNFHR